MAIQTEPARNSSGHDAQGERSTHASSGEHDSADAGTVGPNVAPDVSAPSLWFGFLAALVAVLVLSGIRLLLDPILGGHVPFITLFLAPILAGLAGGLRPAVMATLLSVVAADYLFISPRGSFGISAKEDLASLLTFGIVSLAISAVVGSLWRSKRESQARAEQLVDEAARRTSLVSHKELAEQALRESESRLQLVTDSVPALISYVDKNHIYRYNNAQYEAWYGLERDALTGMHMQELLGEEGYARVLPYVERALQGERVTYEALIPYKYGGSRFVRGEYVPDLDERGESRGFFAFIQDNTARRRHENLSQFLNEASTLLASSLDVEVTLARIAKLAVPHMADWCAVDLLNSSGDLKRIAIEHVEPEKVEWARKLQEKYPSDQNAPQGLYAVLRSGEPELYSSIPEELLLKSARDDEHLRAIREAKIASAMIVPLRARGRTLGVISFVSGEDGRYQQDDLDNALELARRAGLALDNALLYESAQREIADRIQIEKTLRESEERFRMMADSAPVLIWMSGPDKGGTYFNRRWLEFTGRSMEQELGEGWFESIHPDDLRLLEPCSIAFEERTPFTTQFRMRRADGVYRWLLDTGLPRFEPDGTFLGFIGSCIDITEHHQAEEAMRLSEQEFRAIFQMAGSGKAMVRPDGHFARANPKLCEITGYSESELLAMTFAELTHPDDREATVAATQDLISGKSSTLDLEKRYVRKDGKVIWVRVTASVIRDSAGTPVFIASVIQDITAGQEAQKALRESEERFRFALASGALTVYEHDLELRYLWIYPSTPHSRQGIGKTDADLLPAGEARELMDLKRQVLETGKGQRKRVKVSVSNGTRYYDLLVEPRRDTEGNLIGVGGAGLDITEQELAEEALRESAGRLRAIVETAVDAIITIDERGVIGSFNKAAEHIFGYSAAEVTGRNVSKLMPEPYRSEHDGYLENYMETGEKKIIGIGREVVGLRKDGSTFPMELAVSETRLDDRRIFTGLVRDISERKNAEREILELNQSLEERVARRTAELEDANRELQGFAYSIAHDMRTYLRSIVFDSRLLAEDVGEEIGSEAKQGLESLDRNARQAVQLVDGLLAFTRLGREEMVVSEIDLTRLALQTVEQVEDEHPGLDTQISVAPGLRVRGDERLLHTVLHNLMENAFKYQSDGSVRRVEVGLAHDDSREQVFFVRDNGLGFDMEFAEKVFEPFVRLHRDADYPGTGIGLANARRIIDKHGGRIWAESKAGEGATFYFSLPKQSA